MNEIIAAIAVGVLLLWGGIAGLLRLVDLFERKHIVYLGLYSTLVAAGVMGLVLYTSFERQKDHRRQLQEQMEQFSDRLQELSAQLLAQLEQKADLTASEFEIRQRLQNEQASHADTQRELREQQQQYDDLKATLDRQLVAQREYEARVDSTLRSRFAREDERYRGLQGQLQSQGRALETTQRQVATLLEDLRQLTTQTTALQRTQNNLLSRVDRNRAVVDSTTRTIFQQLDGLARAQAAQRSDLDALKTQIDSLYRWNQR